MEKSFDYKGKGGKLIRISMEEERDRIRSIKITGDFFLIPEESLGKLETLLVDAPLRKPDLQLLIDRFFSATRAQGLGVSSEDLVNAILSAKGSL